MSSQLRSRELKPGDILLKINDGSLIGRAIEFGQSVMGGRNSSIVHAGVIFEPPFIIEAQGSGISANDLRVQNLTYGYLIIRCTDANMAAGAGTCAKVMFDIQQRGKNLPYTVPGAVGSLFGGPGQPATRSDMDALFDRILDGKSHPFFCSQFVVFVYQFVAEQCGIPAEFIFKAKDAKVSPSALAAMLTRSGSFYEAGYLMAGER